MALAGGAPTVPAAVIAAAAITAFKGFTTVPPFHLGYRLPIKPSGPEAGLAFQSMTAASLRSVIGGPPGTQFWTFALQRL